MPLSFQVPAAAHAVAALRRGRHRGFVTSVTAVMVVLATAAAPVVTKAADPAAAHSAHGEDHGGDHAPEIGHNPPPGVSQEDFESPAWFQLDLALWSFAVFVLLLILLTTFAWKPIMEGLEKRERGIAETIAATRAAHDEAKGMLASYERRLAEAAEEVRGMLEEARRDAESTRTTIIAEARSAAEEEHARARRDIRLATDDALATISQKAGDLAVEVAGKFIKEKIGAEDQARLVRESLADIRSRPSLN